jgi:hypothetical protein
LRELYVKSIEVLDVKSPAHSRLQAILSERRLLRLSFRKWSFWVSYGENRTNLYITIFLFS